MPYNEAEGTQACTVGTEHTLTTLTNNKTFVFKADLNAMAAGDTVVLRIYDTVLEDGTERVAYKQSYSDAQDADAKIVVSIPVPADIQFKATIKQTAGVSCSIPWKILSL